MSGLLRPARISDAQRETNAATHQASVVLAVLAMLAVYVYLFTHAASVLGLPMPEELAHRAGLLLRGVFDSDHNVDSEIWIYRGNDDYSADDQRLILFGVVAGAFLSAYFLPLRHKQTALLGWFLFAGMLLYGFNAIAGLVAAHLCIYLLFHQPSPKVGIATSLAAGVLGGVALSGDAGLSVTSLLWGVAAKEIYRLGLPLLVRNPKALALARTLAIQSALAVVVIGALVEGWRGDAWTLPLGILLFFWQWERLMMYQIDFNNGQVPKDLPLVNYLAVFLTPGALPNWHWGVTIGQGYAYLNSNFLCEDKNRLAMAGLRIWAVALVYLVFGEWLRFQLVDIFSSLGVDVHKAKIKDLVCDFVDTHRATTASVLLTTLLDLIRWFMLWAAALHFKTGLWRVCGYRMDPYFDRPWLATNLVAFWSRFTFHYREFLVRAFFYPVFFRFFRDRPALRIVAATLAAATFGNLVWGHLTEEMYYHGLRFNNFGQILQTWPYFLLLGIGISLTELYLLRKRSTRKPWTLDWRIPMDVLAVYLTWQFYALIHVYARPCGEGSLADYTRLFLLGFGISL